MKDIKVIFMGTPEFSVPVLEGLIENTNVILVVSQPDKEVGRKKELSSSPIKKVAQKNNIEVYQPNKIRREFDKIIEMRPDIIITCAYGQIIPKEILDCPRLGCINVHASLLPKLRGGAPIHKAILSDYQKTGITIMYMDEKMDNGDIISQREYEIKTCDNVGTLHDILSIMGRELLLDTLPSIINGSNPRIKQNEDEVTFAYNIKREEEHVNFNRSCREIFNHIRGLYPFPKAYTIINDEEFKLLESYYEEKSHDLKISTIVEIRRDAIGIACRDGIVYITRIKPFGKKEMLVQDYLNGIDKSLLLGLEVK